MGEECGMYQHADHEDLATSNSQDVAKMKKLILSGSSLSQTNMSILEDIVQKTDDVTLNSLIKQLENFVGPTLDAAHL